MSTERGANVSEQSTEWYRRGIYATGLAATLLVASACSSNTESGTVAQQSSRPAPAAASTAPRPTKSPACHLQGAKFESSIKTDGDAVQLSRYMVGNTIDMAPHVTDSECYEQITFRFDGKRKPYDTPGVYAKYVDKPIRENPSDNTIKVDGNAFIEVNIGSWWYKSGGGEGPRTIDSTMQNVQTVQQTQNYEGVSTWVVGLNEKQPFIVTPVSGTPDCPVLCYALTIQALKTSS